LDQLLPCLDNEDVACFQLRLKDQSDDDLCRLIDVLRPQIQRRDVAFILNDRPDLAFETGCDGVHIGQSDGSFSEARAMIGPDKIIGVTCHNSRHLAIEAAEKGADYVAFGAFYPTTTKEVSHHADLDLLSWWQDVIEVPSVAIGGITTENASEIVKAGADFIAVSSALWNNQEASPFEVVKKFNAIFQDYR
jgi:thiamine-phosphate pyrophosphorylase